MNVIVSNKNQGLLRSLDIDVIKSINGEFTAEEISGTFSNFFFNRMFLDVTAIKDYANIANIQKLSMNLDMSKVILLLDGELMANKNYISKLISMGIYNFGQNKESLMYMYNHPNTYKDVAQFHEISSSSNSPEPSEENNKKSKIFGNIGNKNNNEQTKTTTPNIKTAKVIGFKNVTTSAGATTLIYMLKKYLSNKEYCVALEINKNDFGFFNEKDMYSINQNNLGPAINKFSNAKYILVDLNNTDSELCDEVINLIEPSTIKLNKLMLVNKGIFDKLYGKKVVLNQSLLSEDDVKEFERESNTQILFNVPPLNDHEKNIEVLKAFIDEIEEI